MCTHDRNRLASCVSPFALSLSRRRFVGLLGGAAAGFVCLSAGNARADAARVDLPAPGPEDTCPVCGMFVAKYPEWVATVVYKDGGADHFDGAKDFFKFLGDVPHYVPGRAAADIKAMGVTDYYSVERIDAKAALYVMGSDVLGPMGHELIPHATRADGDAFLADHAATRLLTFDEVTPAVIADLDAGRVK